MNFFNYAIKCVIRNLIYKLMKPRNLIILLVSVVIIFILSSYTSVFGYEGNNDYTDKNQTIIVTYESIMNDFLTRLDHIDKNNVNYSSLMASLNQSNWNFYVYYGDKNGRDMTGGNYMITSQLNIVFYDKNNPGPSISALDDMYFGMKTSMYNLSSSIQDYYVFDTDVLYYESTPTTCVIPGVLISYTSTNYTNFVNNHSSSETSTIVGAINQQTNSINDQTNTIQEQTQVIQETQDFITDDSVDNSQMTVDNSYSVNDGGVLSFFTNFLNTVKSIFTDIDTSVDVIVIPLPNDNQITLYSNLLSKYIINTPIYSLIQAFWWFVFGRYIITFIKRMIDWLSTGEMADKGVFSFIEWLDINNEIIKSYMM